MRIYLSLWTRLAAAHDDLTSLLYARSVVRGSLLCGTQHVAAADDYAWLQPVMERGRKAAWERSTAGTDPAELSALAGEAPRDRAQAREVSRLLSERWPNHDGLALGWSAQALLPVVHPLAACPSADDLVLRYLAART